jgi:cytochrome P450
MLLDYVADMVRCTDQVTATWGEGERRDMLTEMRRAALLILFQTLFRVDFRPDLERLWSAVLRALKFISPGAWLFWPDIPRPGYGRALRQLDDYLFEIIRLRRADPGETDDLLGLLVANPEIDNDLIRDQLLTMFVAGHDTSTALMAWTLYLLGRHPAEMARVQAEVDTVLGCDTPTYKAVSQLKYLDQVVKETLRMYPPVHAGMRIAAIDLEFQGYHIPAGTRLLYSVYLSHRQTEYWPQPERFMPDRFSPEQNRDRVAHTYVPFGGGPRNCIGAAFGLVETKVVLARLLQQFELDLSQTKVHPHMGATLEPRPGVLMAVQRRSKA